jgi:hypothetical protein
MIDNLQINNLKIYFGKNVREFNKKKKSFREPSTLTAK